ncbi:hypothetical protein H8E77_06810 [bacterium]|nr:hypothetical protein [bacterium]
MPQDGWRSYFIIGEQTDWDTQLTGGGSMKQIIYELISTTLAGASDPITPTRIHRNPSPVKNIPGVLNAGGDIVLHHHPEHMLMFWKHLLLDDATDTDFTAQEVYGNGAGVGKAYTATNSLDTQPSATTTPSDPGKMIVTLASETGAPGTVIITGTDQNGTAITETLSFTTGDESQTTTFYFQTVNVNGVTTSGLNNDGTMLIMCDKNIYTHVFALGDNVYVDEAADKHGLTIELVKGAIPNTYVGCLLNSGTLELADTTTLTLNILAKQANYRLALDGTGTATDISGFGDMMDATYPDADDIFPGWGMAVQLDSVQTDVESASFSFSNNLDYPTRYKASRPMSKPVRQGDRDISFTCAVDYEAVADGGVNFDDKYYGDVPIAVIFSAVSKPYAGPEYTISLSLPRCQLIAHSDPEVGGQGDLLQTLTLRPIRTVGATTSDEAVLTIVSTEAAE